MKNLGAVGSGLGLVLLVEVVLRLVGYGPDDRLVVPSFTDQGRTVYTLNHRAAARFFFRRVEGARVRAPVPFSIEFAMPKPPGTCRIVVLGGSTVAGFPYPRGASFAALVAEMLRDVCPSRSFEVINGGMAAVNSFALADFAAQIVDFAPDLVILHTGHNEFYGPHGVGSTMHISDRRWVIHAYDRVQRTRLYHLTDSTISGVRGWLESPGPRGQADLLPVMIGRAHIARTSGAFATAMDAFHDNVADILNTLGSHHVPVLVTTVASNERDFYPLASSRAPGLDPGALEQWGQAYDRGVAHEQARRWQEAARAYREALTLDDTSAELRFRLGRCLAAAGQHADAAVHFRHARDLDLVRLRAPTRVNAILRELATGRSQTGGVYFCDVAGALRAHAPNGILGNELITEHVHPNRRGHYLIARTLVEFLAAQPAAAGDDRPWLLDKLIRAASYERRVGYEAIDELLALTRLKTLWTREPFRGQPHAGARVAELQTRIDAIYNDASRIGPIERQSLQAMQGRFSAAQIHHDLGRRYLDAKQYAEARRHLRIALNRIGDRARVYLMLAHASLGLNEPARALAHARDARRRGLDVPELYRIEGRVYERMGRREDAARVYRQAAHRFPDAPRRGPTGP